METNLGLGDPTAASSRQAMLASAANPDHHIWNNNGTYYLHVTLRWNGGRKLRLRKSLGTKDVGEARARRDRLLARMERQPELELLIR